MPARDKTIDQRRIKGMESRQLIVDAAIKCIAQRGLCDTTLDRVAQMAGVSRALLVFHFQSKKGLLTAVLAHISAVYDAGWQAISANAQLSAPERLHQLVAYDVKLPSVKPDLLSVWHSFWGEAKGLYKELGYTRDQRYEQDIQKQIEALVKQAHYNIDAHNTTQALMAMLFGIWWNAHLKPSDSHFEDSMRIIDAYLYQCFPAHYPAHTS